MLILGFTILLGAFLLFQVELIIGKCILPWFGGASAVWITCMLFFQIALLGGYLYAHLLDKASIGKQSRRHGAFLMASLLTLAIQFFLWHTPLILDPSWKPRSGGIPFLQVLTLLGVSVGLPYIVLTSTAPLLQSWWRRLYPSRSPYRLYALSNFGSFLGLLSYPLLVEPFLHLKTQAQLWAWAYVAFALGLGYCSFRVGIVPVSAHPEDLVVAANEQSHPPTVGHLFLWLSLSACASALFLSTTNQLCKNVAPVPLLWVLPLALYLLTFTLCFESERRYSRKWFHAAFVVAMFLTCFVLAPTGVQANLVIQIAIYSFVLFAFCMVCHGELVRLKPDPRYLTQFYMSVATGGAIGGVFVALAAPYLFRGYWEYPISVFIAAALFFWILIRDRSSWLYQPRVKSQLTLLVLAAFIPATATFASNPKELIASLPPVLALVIVVILFYRQKTNTPSSRRSSLIAASSVTVLVTLGFTLIRLAQGPAEKVDGIRNFYGALTVEHRQANDPLKEAYALEHGEVVHGFEFRSPERQTIPTSYYNEDSGVGLVLKRLSEDTLTDVRSRGLRIGIVGLGIGTIAAYGRAADFIRFYEINPAVVQLAFDTRYFHFLEKCPAKLEIVLGDARLSLERELGQGSPQDFDLLILDAFSGDAIPVHLLTDEAFSLYFRHLQNPKGILAVHVTNAPLDLRPVVAAAAHRSGAANVWIHNEGAGEISSTNDWVLVSRHREVIESLAESAKHGAELPAQENRLWTDDYSNLFQSLRWR